MFPVTERSVRNQSFINPSLSKPPNTSTWFHCDITQGMKWISLYFYLTADEQFDENKSVILNSANELDPIAIIITIIIILVVVVVVVMLYRHIASVNYVQNIIQYPAVKVNPICRRNYWGLSVWISTQRVIYLIIYSASVKHLRKIWEYNEAVHQLFIGFKKDYDSLRKEVL